jgi:CDP-4-dehydro-6-deoxyglucose reductase, E3
MSRQISISRAARLVGVKRGVLQHKIRAGELLTFEGKVLLSDLLQIYPDASINDSSMLERVEQIMESAVYNVSRLEQNKPTNTALSTRVLAVSQQLATQQRLVGLHRGFITSLTEKMKAFRNEIDRLGTPHGELVLIYNAIENDLFDLDNNQIESSRSIGNEVFLRIMTAQATLLPSGHEFFIEGADSLLEAGLRGGLALSYGCSNGNCGLCKMRVVSGEIQKIKQHDFTLTETEKYLGYILGCSNTAVSDVVLEAEEASGAFDIPRQSITLRPKKIEHLDSSIIIVNTKTARSNRLRFLAGQSVKLDIPNIGSEEFYVASCPCDDMNLQFHISSSSNGPVSNQIRSNHKIGDKLYLTGPTGSFTLNENSPNSLVFIAQGGGLAPIKGLIEHAMALDSAEDIYLYWLSDVAERHYLGNLCRSWDDALDNFHFLRIPDNSYDPVKQAAIINDALNLHHKNTDNLDFYLCASDSLIAKVKDNLEQHAISEYQIMSTSIAPSEIY